jgi:NDP-hexose C3-ketoreductase / dTDP-4-oxo-2-deoxy-alpha-D-pentos-2-ene 2,3-reductase
MEYTYLGRSGLSVSRLCLGTMNFGPQTGEEDAHTIMDAALDAGINFFDTANVYGWKRDAAEAPAGMTRSGKGATETIIGNWFAGDQARREKVVLATKVYGSMGDWPNQMHLSKRNIITACEASLKRLQTDHIDLYQMHHVDRNSPWDEVWEAFETLVTQGKVLYAGSSNFAGWHIARAQEAARGRHFLGLVSEQSLYNLVERSIELEVLPACREYGVGVIPWSPLSRGLLGGILRKTEEGRSTSAQTQALLRKHHDQIRRYEDLCREIGHHPANVGLAWLLAQPGVTAPITGPRTLDQLKQSLEALDVVLGEDTLARLDEIFPGYRTAPEQYAW